jgi:Tol biopolymer transport system component
MPNHPGSSTLATPGWGGYSDLWIASADGSQAWQLTNLPVNANSKTILPMFSPNERLLEWTEASPVGGNRYWVIKIAQFNVDSVGKPYLTNIQTLSPGGYFTQEFIETGGFSADSSTMLFTSDFQTRQFLASQIYSLNLATGAITRLTSGTHYNEHPRFTPLGQIIWVSNADVPLSHAGGTEWWMMNADGSGQQKLSYFNSPSSLEYFGQTVYAGTVNTENWSSDGFTSAGDVELNLKTSQSDIVRVTLTCH